MTLLFYPNFMEVSRKSGTFFLPRRIYCPVGKRKDVTAMRESNDPNADLDDLIFEEGDGGPSER